MIAPCEKEIKKNVTFEKVIQILVMPKVSQELLCCRIQNFEPDPMLHLKFKVFILFCKVTSGGKMQGCFKKLHNIML